MSLRFWSLFGLGVLLALPGVRAGTESEPEVSDPADDVNYGDPYPFAKDHPYLDVTAAWWSYDNLTDTIGFWIKGTDFSAYAEPPPPDHFLECRLRLEASLEGQNKGWIFLQLGAARNVPAYTSLVQAVDREDGEGIIGRPVAHTFAAAFESPGRLEFQVSRGALLGFVDALAVPRVNCREEYFPATDYPLRIGNVFIVGNPMSNWDNANGSTAKLDLLSLRPLAAPGAPECEAEEACVPTGVPETAESASPKNSTPGVGAASVAVAFAFAVARRDSFRHT